MPGPVVHEWVHRKLATPGGLVTFMRELLGKPIQSLVMLGQVTKNFAMP